jgi:hypothetical protein
MFRKSSLIGQLNHMLSHTRKAPRKPRRFCYESLEDRRLMAVTPSMKNGLLTITGDNSDDKVVITGSQIPGEVFVNGERFTGLQHIKIDLKHGNDTVEIKNLAFGKLDMNTGTGSGRDNDQITFQNVHTYGPTSIKTGTGNDVVTITNSNFHSHSTKIDLGDGDDSLNINRSTVGAPLTIDASNGNDRVSITQSHLYSVNVALGYGYDSLVVAGSEIASTARFDASNHNDAVTLMDSRFLNTLSVNLGDGNDWLRVINCYARCDADLNVGDGNDDVAIERNSVFGRNLKVNTGDGNDMFVFTNSRVYKQASLSGGDNSDAFIITDAVFGDLAVDLGSGADGLGIRGIAVSDKTKLNGGSGTDWFYNGGGNSFGSYATRSSFETTL